MREVLLKVLMLPAMPGETLSKLCSPYTIDKKVNDVECIVWRRKIQQNV